MKWGKGEKPHLVKDKATLNLKHMEVLKQSSLKFNVVKLYFCVLVSEFQTPAVIWVNQKWISAFLHQEFNFLKKMVLYYVTYVMTHEC